MINSTEIAIAEALRTTRPFGLYPMSVDLWKAIRDSVAEALAEVDPHFVLDDFIHLTELH